MIADFTTCSHEWDSLSRSRAVPASYQTVRENAAPIGRDPCKSMLIASRASICLKLCPVPLPHQQRPDADCPHMFLAICIDYSRIH